MASTPQTERPHRVGWSVVASGVTLVTAVLGFSLPLVGTLTLGLVVMTSFWILAEVRDSKWVALASLVGVLAAVAWVGIVFAVLNESLDGGWLPILARSLVLLGIVLAVSGLFLIVRPETIRLARSR